MMEIKKKRLFFDIETSPNVGLFWSSGYKLNIPCTNIIKERAIICISYKWAGDDKIYSLTWDNKQNDKSMLEKFIPIANEADELVAHNGDRFDLPWIRTRCLFHRIPMFPSYTSIDTLIQSRARFRFNNNSLDYIANFLGLGGKLPTGFDLWKKIVLNNDKKALNEMMVYCENDVILLEKVYNTMANYFPHKTHYGPMLGEGKSSCPECGSSNLRFNRRTFTASGIERIQLECNDCGKYNTVSAKIWSSISKNR